LWNKQKQIVTWHKVINLLSDDEDDPEDGKPATNPAPAPMAETVSPPFVPVVKI